MTKCLLCATEYERSSPRQKWCTGCTATARKNYAIEYEAKNRDVILEKRKVYMAERARADPEKRRAEQTAWRNKNKAVLNERRRTPEARAKASARLKAKYAADEGRRIHNRMASAIYQAMKGRKGGRKWETLVGYTLADLVSHLERQFPKGMTWENMGQWHIDHIRPKKDFDQTDPVQFRECWGLLNLRPLWAPANQAKAGRREHLL